MPFMDSESAFIDANALADFFVGEDDVRRDSETLRRKHSVWVTLPLCRHEFGNVLRKYTRHGKIGAEDGLKMLRQGLAMVAYCADCTDEVVLSEANASNLSFYDAAYVARARSLGVWLYTRDDGILKNCPDVARAIAEL